jgi:hypothetical protein
LIRSDETQADRGTVIADRERDRHLASRSPRLFAGGWNDFDDFGVKQAMPHALNRHVGLIAALDDDAEWFDGERDSAGEFAGICGLQIDILQRAGVQRYELKRRTLDG